VRVDGKRRGEEEAEGAEGGRKSEEETWEKGVRVEEQGSRREKGRKKQGEWREEGGTALLPTLQLREYMGIGISALS
jgi:hypothetical protein